MLRFPRPARIVVPVLVGILVGLVAAWPYIQYAGLPSGTDAELHVYRIAELGYSVKAGSLYPRWAPDFYHGYGYPIFNYYAPLSYHLGYWLTLGRPELAADAARLLYLLVYVGGATGAYLLGAIHGGRTGQGGAGFLGALAFSFAPYVQLINPHIRGDLPESLALAALPWTLWAWELFWRRGGRLEILAAVCTTAFCFLSHNLTGLTCVVLVGALTLWRWHGRDRARLRRAVLVGATFVLLTSFFWLPFLAERSAIQLAVAGEGHYDFRNHFVHIRELLSLIAPIDRRAASPNVPMTAGPHLVVLALLGFGVAVKRSGPKSAFGDLGFYLVAALLLAFLTQRLSQPLWEMLPGFAYYQFPWRFLGPFAVLLVPLVSSLASGMSIWERLGANGRALIPGIAAVLILLAAMPALYVPGWESGFGAITPNTLIEVELEGRWRGTTSTNDFVPATVDIIPGPQDAVVASYKSPPVDRVNRATLPESASVQIVPAKPWIHRFRVQADVAFTLRLFLFDFPGWRAYVDGVQAPIELARPEGFITVCVPAGEHEVVVRFGATPARTAGWGLSFLGLVALVILLVTAHPWSLDKSDGWDASASSAPLVSVLVAVGLVVGLKLAVFDAAGTFVEVSPPGEVAIARYRQEAILGSEISLLGYDLGDTVLRSGDLLDVVLYWQAQRPVTQTYQSFVHLVYPEGQIWKQSDHLNPAGYPTNLWPTTHYLRDVHKIWLPDDLPAGTYLLVVGLYSLEGNWRLSVDAATCGQRHDAIVLCQPITVR